VASVTAGAEVVCPPPTELAADFARALVASPIAAEAPVAPAGTGAAPPVLITIAAATGSFVPADEAAAEFAFGAAPSSLSSFGLLPDEVLVVGESASTEVPAGFTPARTVAAWALFVSGCAGGLSVELTVVVVSLLAGCVVGLLAV
jgi:hypothetical protein